MFSTRSPAVLLVLTGALLGLTFPFGKLASLAAVPPVVWALLVSLGAGASLLAVHLARGGRLAHDGVHLRYYLLSALVSLVVPNLLIFSVIPRLGSGFTGVLFTLSPVITLLLSSIWRVHLPGRIGIAGIAIGFAGALVVAATRGEVGQPAAIGWVLAGLGIPLSLAVGNLYRTMAWPPNANPIELAIGSNLAAASVLLAILVVTGGLDGIGALAAVPGVALAQVAGSAAMFSLFFRLQQVGGPTYLSQIGYVGAGVALFSGTVLLGERYAWTTWAGALVIVAGIALSIVSERRRLAAAAAVPPGAERGSAAEPEAANGDASGRVAGPAAAPTAPAVPATAVPRR